MLSKMLPRILSATRVTRIDESGEIPVLLDGIDEVERIAPETFFIERDEAFDYKMVLGALKTSCLAHDAELEVLDVRVPHLSEPPRLLVRIKKKKLSFKAAVLVEDKFVSFALIPS